MTEMVAMVVEEERDATEHSPYGSTSSMTSVANLGRNPCRHESKLFRCHLRSFADHDSEY